MKTETLVIGLLATAALGGLGYYVYVSTKKPEPKKGADLPAMPPAFPAMPPAFPAIPGLPMPVVPGQPPVQPAGQGQASDLLQQGAAAANAAAKAAQGFFGNPFGGGPVSVTPGPTTPASFTPAKQEGGFTPLSFGGLINPMLSLIHI